MAWLELITECATSAAFIIAIVKLLRSFRPKEEKEKK